jgi:hypothetical protein
MAKKIPHIPSYEELTKGKPELHQCPCDPACKCEMDDPCFGCETYGEWLTKEKE